MGVDRHAGAGGQHRVQAEGQARGVDHLFHLGRHRLGHAHAAVRRVAANTYPTAFSVGFVGVLEASRGEDRAILPAAAFFVAAAAERGDGLGGDFAGFFEDCLNGLGVDGFRQRGQLGPEFGDLENFVEDEAHIAQRRFVVSHGKPRENFNVIRVGSVLQTPSVTEQLL